MCALRKEVEEKIKTEIMEEFKEKADKILRKKVLLEEKEEEKLDQEMEKIVEETGKKWLKDKRLKMSDR